MTLNFAPDEYLVELPMTTAEIEQLLKATASVPDLGKLRIQLHGVLQEIKGETNGDQGNS